MSRYHDMSSADAAWLRMDRRTNPMVINAVLWFEEPLDPAALEAVFVERVVDRFPRFRQRVEEGLPGRPPRWCDDERFEPDLHFRHVALPAPGDRRVLETVVSDLVSTPLNRDRPLWEVHLLDGYGTGCAVLVRMHHAIADGIALARVMLSVTDGGETEASFVPAPAPASRLLAPVSIASALVRGALDLVREPGWIPRDARTLAKLLLPGSDRATSLRAPLLVRHRVAWSAPVRLSTVKRAGRARGATVNDVLVAAVAGAVGEHLRERGEQVDEVHALVPFNLRPLDRPLPADLGNRFGLILLALPVGLTDPVQRLAAVRRRMDEIKGSHEGPISYGILGAIGRMPAQVEARLVDFFSAKGSMVLTNVPGPREEVRLAGVPLRGVLVWAPCSGSVGMSVSIFSYAGRVTVGFLTDAAVIDDPQALADAFRAQVLRLARGGARTGESARAARSPA